MKARYTFYLLFFSVFSMAQTAKDYAVQLRAAISDATPSVTISWPSDTTGLNYIVYRKEKSSLTWGTPLATLPKTATQYIDNNAALGSAYEYYVRRTYTAANRVAHGYIYAGIKLPETIAKGTMLLLVDANYAQPLAAEISTLQLDLVADGWAVQRMDISRTASVAEVKNSIRSRWSSDTTIAAVFLLGKIPVPYSGGFKAVSGQIYPPDGHPEHGGAWPADLYYGMMNENFWTDTDVNDTTPQRAQNDNIPGDGKFDQIYLYPEQVQLQVGRVDLTNMSTFGSNDTLRIKRYLERAHDYKLGKLQITKRALVDDNFGAMSGEAFAASGWRNFSAMYADSVFARDYFTALKSGNYQFAYGCGAGSYTSCSGVGNTANYNNDSVNGIFSMTFGSYFGDWDSPNNFLRAPLCASKPMLVSMWSGRPHWHLHHIALGENIGYAARLTQNNYYSFTGTDALGYVFNSAPTFIHIALMGDPSLRLHPIKPPVSVQANPSADSMKVLLSWQASPDAEGYVVVRARNLYGPYKQVARLTTADTLWTDPSPDNGMNYYMVRAMRLEQTPSGSYYNVSLGLSDSAFSKSFNASAPAQQLTQPVLTVYPNPTSGLVYVWHEHTPFALNARVYDLQGRLVLSKQLQAEDNSLHIAQAGIYILKLSSGDMEQYKKIVVR
jgi:hypothetical protein